MSTVQAGPSRHERVRFDCVYVYAVLSPQPQEQVDELAGASGGDDAGLRARVCAVEQEAASAQAALQQAQASAAELQVLPSPKSCCQTIDAPKVLC